MNDYVGGKAWKQEKHDRIVQATYKFFAERGIEQVSMTEVAEAGNVSRANLFLSPFRRRFASSRPFISPIMTSRNMI